MFSVIFFNFYYIMTDVISQEQVIADEEQFYNDSGLFDIKEFNKTFENRHKIALQKKLLQDEEQLKQFNNANNSNVVQPYNKNMYENLVGIKRTIIGIITDFIGSQFESIMTKNNRLYYIGLIFIIIAILLFCLNELFQ